MKPLQIGAQMPTRRLFGKRGGSENAQEVSFFPSGGLVSAQVSKKSKNALEVSEPSKLAASSPSSGTPVRGIGQGGKATDYYSILHAYLDSAKVFPRTLKELGLSGTVRVQFTVSKEGYLEQIQIAQSDAPQILQAEALRFLKKLERVPVPPSHFLSQDLKFELPLRYELTG